MVVGNDSHDSDYIGLMFLLKFLFFYWYKVVLKTPSNRDYPQQTAGIALSVMASLNFLVFYLVYLRMMNLESVKIAVWPFLLVFVLLNLICSRIIIRDDNYINIIEELSSTSWIKR